MLLSKGMLFGGTGLPLRVLEATARAPSGPVTAEAVKVVLTLNGRSEVRFNNDKAVLNAGTILLIPADSECSGHPAIDTRTVTFYMHEEFLRDQLKWLQPVHPFVHQLQLAIHGEQRLRLLEISESRMHALTAQLLHLTRLTEHPSNELTILAASTNVFDTIGRFAGLNIRGSMSAGSTQSAPRREVAAATALLRDQLTHRWRITELADALALSGSQLSRLFRHHLGLSPAEYLWQLRTTRMAELLLVEGLNVSEAAQAVGWHNPSSASRSFKRRYGVSPREFSASHRDVRHHARNHTLPPQ